MDGKIFSCITKEHINDLEDVVQDCILRNLMLSISTRQIMLGVDPDIVEDVFDIINEMGYRVEIMNTTTFIVSWW